MSKITMDEVAKEWLRLSPPPVTKPDPKDGWRDTMSLAILWGLTRNSAHKRLEKLERAKKVERISCGKAWGGNFWRPVKKGKK